jgi:photosystem II stability/assembly factor-like uncharacterized protein
MKKKLLIVVSFICATNLFAQWEWQSPLPQGNTLNDVKIVSEKVVLAIGELGTVIRSTDTGETWKLINLGTETNLVSLSFADEQTGYILGINGTVFKTTDCGINWSVQNPGIKTIYYSICFVDKDTGFVAGYYGTILKTTDGGNTWAKKNSKTISTLNKIIFLNNKIGFAVGKEGVVVKTTDSGNTWKGASISSGIDLKSIFFTDENNGWTITANGKIYKTTDGGDNWVEQYSNSSMSYTSLWFADLNNGKVWGNYNCATIDGGKTWTSEMANYFKIIAVDMRNNLLGFLVGQNGLIKKTVDGGATWKNNMEVGYHSYMNIIFTDKNIGWHGDTGKGVYKTTDGGTTWEKKLNIYCNKIYCSDEKTIYVFGDSLRKSTDSGETWKTIRKQRFSGTPVASIIDSSVFAVDQGSLIYNTTNNGTDWNTAIISNAGNWQTIFFINKLIGWVAGGSGSYAKTTDGGITWEKKEIPRELYFSIYFIDEKAGWICGGNGTILYTADGGETWLRQNASFGTSLRDIRFLNKLYGYAVGEEGTIFKTTNGGSNWTSQKSRTTNNLYSVFIIDENRVWISGENSTLLKTTNGGTTFIEQEKEKEIPADFILSQNYPNPFNPETTISYKIQAASQVSLKVYDVLGREVVTLVDEYKQPGSYNCKLTRFDSRLARRGIENGELPSGVYFYRLQAGNFVQTKKMLLIK